MSLCTLTNVKNYMDIDVNRVDTVNDALITSIIDRLSARIKNYCDRDFESQEYTEYYNGNNDRVLYLNNYPITSVSGIWDDSGWTWGSDMLIDSNTYKINNNQMSVILKSNTTHFGNYIENIKIIYTAGYITIPTDLVDVCVIETVSSFKRRKDPYITSKSMGDGSSTRYETDFLPSTISILNKYKSYRII